MSVAPKEVEFDQIVLGENPRKDLGDVQALAEKIKREGLIQPLVVEVKKVDGKTAYVLKVGSRRYAAIKKIREEDPKAFSKVPVMVSEGGDGETARIFLQIAENIDRKDLNPIELADALEDLRQQGNKDADIASRVGLSTVWVQKLAKVRTECCDAVKKALIKGEISVAAAYDLMNLSQEKQEKELEKYKETKKTKGVKAAKRGATKGGGKQAAPGKRVVAKLLTVIDEYGEEEEAFQGDMWHGVTIALRFALGQDESLIAIVETEAEKHGIDLNSGTKAQSDEEE